MFRLIVTDSKNATGTANVNMTDKFIPLPNLTPKADTNQTADENKSPEALNDKATALYNQGKYAEAITYYDKALAIDPNDKEALNGKGDALYYPANDTQGYEKAIQYYDKALAINPNYKDALNGKGNALSSQGNNIQAITYYDKALAIDPKDEVILSNKADSLNSLGKYAEAITYYDKALAIDPNDKEALNGKNDTLSHMPSNKTADENKSPAPNNQTYIKPPLLPPI